jgi:pimeloyl-ACP methyl ester carboxylesterase
MDNARRTVLKSAMSVPLVAAAGCTTTAPTGATGSKTYVLVHGGYHGGWCWSRLTTILQRHGHRTFAPTITGVGDRAHLLTASIRLATSIEDIVRVIETEELTNVVLVGHSIGGIYIAGVADRVPDKIGRLVFLDSVLLDSGQTMLSSLPPDRQEALQKMAAARSNLVAPKPPAKLFGMERQDDEKWVERRLTDHPWSTWIDPLVLTKPFGAGLPKHYIECTKPEFPLVAGSKAKLRKSPDGWKVSSLATGHNAMISAPEELARLLLALD